MCSFASRIRAVLAMWTACSTIIGRSSRSKMSCGTARNTGRSILGDKAADSSVSCYHHAARPVSCRRAVCVNGRHGWAFRKGGRRHLPCIARRISAAGLESCQTIGSTPFQRDKRLTHQKRGCGDQSLAGTPESQLSLRTPSHTRAANALFERILYGYLPSTPSSRRSRSTSIASARSYHKRLVEPSQQVGRVVEHYINT